MGGSLPALTWTELKLFVREPIALVFGFAFPLMILVILLGVFGETVDDDVFLGATGIDYYVPAGVATLIAAVALVSMPVHLAGYIERGVLRRLRASGVRAWTVLAAQAVVAASSIVVGTVLILVLAALVYEPSSPEKVGGAILGLVLGSLSFLALGGLLATVARTSRAAQAIGLLLFFGMYFISGAGPPRAVLPDWLSTAADFMPMTYLLDAIQEPWVGLDTDVGIHIGLTALLVISSVGAALLLRRG